MTVDEILANPLEGLALPDSAIPLSVIVLCEFAEPGSDNRPTARRLATCADDDIAPWTSIGMLRYAMQLDIDSVIAEGDDDDGDD